MSDAKSSRPTVFIDRDGTLIEEVNFLSRVEDLKVFFYTAEALRLLKERGYLIVVLTNQSGIARGIYSEADMHGIHDAMQAELNGAIDAFYHCPHLPNAGCECRKPNLGMIGYAQRDFKIDLSQSWMIGDKKLDVETGKNAGVGSALVLTGYGKQHVGELIEPPDIIGEDLLDAVIKIVSFGRAEAAP